MLRRELFFLLLFLFTQWNVLFAQQQKTVAGFSMHYYSAKEYGMHPRNFLISQDAQGVMYFGNAYGLLNFDGSKWGSCELKNGNSAMSVGIHSSKTLYIGSYDDLGYVVTDISGKMSYTSLRDKTNAGSKDIGEFSNVFFQDNATIYYGLNGLFIYTNNSFKVITPSNASVVFDYMNEVNGHLFVHQTDKGLFELKNLRLLPIVGGDILKDKVIFDIIPFEQQYLILTEKGLFSYDFKSLTIVNKQTNDLWLEKKAKHLIRINSKYNCISTLKNGLYVIDNQGKIVHHLHTGNGLPSNHIEYQFIDKTGRLWIAFDKGIAHIDINSPIQHIGPQQGVTGMGYTAKFFDNKLYVGTSDGLFVAENSPPFRFKSVSDIFGQICDLAIINNALICSQREQTYKIQGNKVMAIHSPINYAGHWKTIKLNNHPTYVIHGTYEGFHLYEVEKDKFQFIQKIDGFSESCRVFEQDKDGTIWVCHGNKGLYKITLTDACTSVKKVENISVNQGFKPDHFNHVSIIDEQVIFSSDIGVYTIEHETGKIKPSAKYNKILKDRYINKIIQTSDSLIWMFSGDEIELFKSSNGSISNTGSKSLKTLNGELVGSYEFVIQLDPTLALIGSQNGFYSYKLSSKQKKNHPFTCIIRSVNQDKDGIRISYSAPFYEHQTSVRYQYALTSSNYKNNTLEWSEFTNHNQVDFPSLFEGKYIFHVRAINAYGTYSTISRHEFRVLPPLYRSFWAYTLYIVCALCMSYLIYMYVMRRFTLQKNRLQAEKRREIKFLEQQHLAQQLQKEKEIIELKNERLEAQVLLKSTELASLATSISQKSEFLSHLKDKLETLKVETKGANDALFKELIKTIEKETDFDDDWKTFQVHFDQLHNNFLHRLREAYPKLNASWLLLCAYIRMNKSNKEIAQQMSVSIAAVEKRKYRLPEKLSLNPDEKLSDFLLKF